MQSSVTLSAQYSSPHSQALLLSNSSFWTSSLLPFCSPRGKLVALLRKSQNSRSFVVKVSALEADNGNPPGSFDYDLVIVGAGVGGHGAALHAVEKVQRLNSFQNLCVKVSKFSIFYLGSF